jgi:hypothetical protein
LINSFLVMSKSQVLNQVNILFLIVHVFFLPGLT